MAKKHSLESLRKKIDEIDSLLIESISERARCAQHVAEVKEAQGDTAYTSQSEKLRFYVV